MKYIKYLHNFDRSLGIPILKGNYVIDYFKHKEVNINLPAPMYAGFEWESEKYKIKLGDCFYRFFNDSFSLIEVSEE
jgi:hypothetical protein